ncbi:L-histidine N(alpha)-methyltransferase [Oxalobacteraceae bacterium CAVE-383]|nr:L-histidine N(alpha)-methyltransferase [Oxalobacteraceae bacterium CAVE-383]
MRAQNATGSELRQVPTYLQTGSQARQDRNDLPECYNRLRSHSEALAAPLTEEDMVVQSMPDASPAKWHLAHTTWFFETFLLSDHLPGYRVFDPAYGYLFNSYYETLGPRQPRPQRGLLTRPTARDVMAYRHYVDEHMRTLLASSAAAGLEDLIRLGLAHEEQHQELLLMDILHLFAKSPLKPAYCADWPADAGGAPARFRHLEGGLVEVGDAGSPFVFDNERPRHTTWIEPFEIADRLVTNGEWLAFMADGGYRRADLWLSDGWTLIRAEGWEAPLYWERDEQDKDRWNRMSLRGLEAVRADAPVTHLSYYEAAAYAQWAGARLPTEAEWETAALAGVLDQMDDVAWQWTQSAYYGYPGFRPVASAVGEYNGKFMIGQMVLRGGASVTPAGHARPTYRNFYRPEQRWMFSGLRLARDAAAHGAHGTLATVDTHHAALSGAAAAPGAAASDAVQAHSEFARDVIAGLSLKEKTLSPKYFYDAAGSELFEDICKLEEYYPTRTETALLRDIAADIADEIPDGAALVEFGSGASDKTRLILDAAPQIAAYVPIDISQDALDKAAARLRRHYPTLKIAPLADDFTSAMQLPASAREHAKVGFFPGSTIGNFTPPQAVAFLRSVRRLLGLDAHMIIGADMVKDEATLVAAYDDAEGVTARFNKNLLVRINRELGGDFDPEAFDHLALWNPQLQRMEMHLVSRADQIVNAAGQTFAFKEGERLHTENSHKFTPESFAALAAQAGWTVTRQWISAAPQFAVFSLR